MKLRTLFMTAVSAALVFSACEEPEGPNVNGSNVPKFDFPFYEAFPIEAGNTITEASKAGVTIEVTKLEDRNVVFELRPGALVQSFKFDMYPLANLYNTLLNSRNSGNLTEGDPVDVNNLIRNLLFTDGSGGYAISVNDYENPEDFLQLEYDWMSTSYAAASAPIIPDCGFIIAVVSSVDPDISSANQEELTLCFFHTTSQPIVGDPQVEIDVNAGFKSYAVQHHPNADAAGIYYYGGLMNEIDEYIDIFGETMYRDFLRTLYSSPVDAADETGLFYSNSLGVEVDTEVMYTATAVAVDANLTPSDVVARRDFHLRDDIPEDKDPDEPVVELIPEKIASMYLQFYVNIPKTVKTIFWNIYTEEEMLALKASSISLKTERSQLLLGKKGNGYHNPDFSWNDAEDVPYEERATGLDHKAWIDWMNEEVIVPGARLCIGVVGRDFYMDPTDMVFSEVFTMDERNLTSPDNCKVKDLRLWADNVTRTTFRYNLSYDPETVSVVHVQWIPELINIATEEDEEEKWVTWQEAFGMTLDSSWSEWVDLIVNVTGEKDTHHKMLNIMTWSVNDRDEGIDGWAKGTDGWVYTGMTPDYKYTLFALAEDYDGNFSRVLFSETKTKELQIGPDPTVRMELKVDEEGEGWDVVYTVDHDVESYRYAPTSNISDLKITGANQEHLNNIAESGITYEQWRDAIYNWIEEAGKTTNFDSVYDDIKTSDVTIAACLAQGRDEANQPVFKMYHLIIKDGVARTLEEIFGIEE